MRTIADYLYDNNRISERLRHAMLSLRLYYPYNILSMAKMRRNRRELLTEAGNYFHDNHDRVKKCLKLLSDEKSRSTYFKLIKLRQTYQKKYIAEYDYFNQYFPADIPEFVNGGAEVFVDCGAFNGDTAEAFARRFPEYGRIVAIEPDRRNAALLRRKRLRSLSIVRAACADYDGRAAFDEKTNPGGSHIIGKGKSECDRNRKINEDTCNIDVRKIDSIPACADATFIKMDIEGSEMSALRGAKETIQRNHPKLAICLYHSNEDMIAIPEYIHELVPEYSLFVRAHTMGIAETVLYAVDRTKKI